MRKGSSKKGLNPGPKKAGNSGQLLKNMVALGIGLWVISLVNDAFGATTNQTGDENSPDLSITDHDEIYNYKRESGIWYAQTKDDGTGKPSAWYDVQKNVSLTDYQLFLVRINQYLQEKNS